MGLQAGVDGRQQLPDKFLIQRSSTTEPPLGILLERDIEVESSLLDKRKVQISDPIGHGIQKCTTYTFIFSDALLRTCCVLHSCISMRCIVIDLYVMIQLLPLLWPCPCQVNEAPVS